MCGIWLCEYVAVIVEECGIYSGSKFGGVWNMALRVEVCGKWFVRGGKMLYAIFKWLSWSSIELLSTYVNHCDIDLKGSVSASVGWCM